MKLLCEQTFDGSRLLEYWKCFFRGMALQILVDVIFSEESLLSLYEHLTSRLVTGFRWLIYVHIQTLCRIIDVQVPTQFTLNVKSSFFFFQIFKRCSHLDSTWICSNNCLEACFHHQEVFFPPFAFTSNPYQTTFRLAWGENGCGRDLKDARPLI